MMNKIKSLRLIATLTLFLLIAGVGFSQNSSQSNKGDMDDLKALVAAHIQENVTDQMFRTYMTTNTDNLAMFRSIQNDLKNHPNYNADVLARVISGMELKLSQE